MSNIKERLRSWQSHKVPIEYLREGADEIERLEDRIMELERDAAFLRAEIETLQRMRHNTAQRTTYEKRPWTAEEIEQLAPKS